MRGERVRARGGGGEREREGVLLPLSPPPFFDGMPFFYSDCHGLELVDGHGLEFDDGSCGVKDYKQRERDKCRESQRGGYR